MLEQRRGLGERWLEERTEEGWFDQGNDGEQGKGGRRGKGWESKEETDEDREKS